VGPDRAAAAKLSFEDKFIPKLELGNEAGRGSGKEDYDAS
jgi:hypothetical protein